MIRRRCFQSSRSTVQSKFDDGGVIPKLVKSILQLRSTWIENTVDAESRAISKLDERRRLHLAKLQAWTDLMGFENVEHNRVAGDRVALHARCFEMRVVGAQPKMSSLRHLTRTRMLNCLRILATVAVAQHPSNCEATRARISVYNQQIRNCAQSSKSGSVTQHRDPTRAWTQYSGCSIFPHLFLEARTVNDWTTKDHVDA